MSDPASGRLLLLDDDPIVTRTLGNFLEDETEWQLHLLNRADQALRVLETQPIDVVVSDYLMPDIDGVKFLSEARRLRPQASRILLTGYADKRNAICSINAVQLYHYIEKPWDNDALLLVLRNAMERTRMLDRLDGLMQRLAQRDREAEEMRRRLLRTIL